jgi:hypothetical protein
MTEELFIEFAAGAEVGLAILRRPDKRYAMFTKGDVPAVYGMGSVLSGRLDMLLKEFLEQWSAEDKAKKRQATPAPVLAGHQEAVYPGEASAEKGDGEAPCA